MPIYEIVRIETIEDMKMIIRGLLVFWIIFDLSVWNIYGFVNVR